MAVGNRVNVGTLFVELLLDDTGVDKGTTRATRRLNAFADGLAGIAGKIDRTITAALTAAAAATTALAAAAAVTGAEFEKEMSKVAAVAGLTGEKGAEGLAALTDEARRIGKETQFSATDAAYGMEALAQSGMEWQEIITATGDAMALAGANAVDLDMATGLVASTLVQFNLRASDAGRVSDVFTAAAQASLLTVEDLAVAMRYAGTAGATLGYSIEETTAAVAMFRNMGLTGEQAGTNFRAMMEGLANPTRKAADTLAALGVTLDEVNPAMHSFDEIVARLADSGIELGQSYAIFGSIAGGNIMSLVEDWREAGDEANAYRDLLDELNTSHGLAARSFEAMADNVAGSWEELKSSAEEFLLVLFDMGKGPLKRLFDELGKRIDFLSQTFNGAAKTGGDRLDALVDGVLALVDAAILLIPRLEEIGVAMVAALVTAKGVTFAAALLNLATQFGVNLPAAIAKAVAALRAMTVAQAAFTVTGLGAVLAGLAALALAIAQVADNFTGAARAARQLEGAQRGLREFESATDEERKEIAGILQRTKDEIAARAAVGEAISNQERALLEYTDAQAFAEVEAGKMLAYHDRLVFTSEASTEAINDFRGALLDSASDAGKTADTLEYLASQFVDTTNPIGLAAVTGIRLDEVMQGSSESLARLGKTMEEAQVFAAMFNGPLSKARELTGLSIHTFEDLTAAVARLRAEQEAAASRAQNLGNQLALQAADAKTARQATDGLASATEDAEAPVTQLTSAERELAREAKKAAKEEEEAAQRRKEAGDGFGNWLETWANDATVGQGLLDDLNAQIRDLPENLARVGQAGQQVIPRFSEHFDLVNANAAGVARELEAINEAMRDAEKREPFEKLREGVAATFARLRQEIEDSGGAWDWLKGKVSGAVEDLAGRLKTGVLDVLKRGAAELWEGMKAGAAQAAGAISSLFGPLFAMFSPAAILGQLAPLFDLAGIFSGSITENETGKPDEQVEKIRAAQAVDAAAQSAVGFVEGLVRALPLMLQKLVEALPVVFDALIEGIPRLIEAVAEALPGLIAVLVEKLPILVDAVLSALPTLIRALGDGIVQLLGMLPDLVTAILGNLPAIITALVEQLPKIIDALVAAVPEIIVAVAEQAPYIIFAIIQALPKIIWAMITLVPRLVVAIIAALPRILGAFWKGFADLWPQFVAWAGNLAKAVGEGLLDVLSLGLFKTSNEKKKGDDGGEFLWGLFNGKSSRAASGIDYVPHTMATVLEPGEAVLDALANQARLRRELNEPGPIPVDDAGGGSFAFEFVFDGRVMDSLLVDGLSRGRAPKLRRALRSTSSRRPGFSRGRFQPFAG